MGTIYCRRRQVAAGRCPLRALLPVLVETAGYNTMYGCLEVQGGQYSSDMGQRHGDGDGKSTHDKPSTGLATSRVRKSLLWSHMGDCCCKRDGHQTAASVRLHSSQGGSACPCHPSPHSPQSTDPGAPDALYRTAPQRSHVQHRAGQGSRPWIFGAASLNGYTPAPSAALPWVRPSIKT